MTRTARVKERARTRASSQAHRERLKAKALASSHAHWRERRLDARRQRHPGVPLIACCGRWQAMHTLPHTCAGCGHQYFVEIQHGT